MMMKETGRWHTASAQERASKARTWLILAAGFVVALLLSIVNIVSIDRGTLGSWFLCGGQALLVLSYLLKALYAHSGPSPTLSTWALRLRATGAVVLVLAVVLILAQPYWSQVR